MIRSTRPVEIWNVASLHALAKEGRCPQRAELVANLLLTWNGDLMLRDPGSPDQLSVEENIRLRSFAETLGDHSGTIRNVTPGLFQVSVEPGLLIRVEWCVLRTNCGKLIVVDFRNNCGFQDVTELVGYRAIQVGY